MNNNPKNRDLISEDDYTRQMASRSTNPQKDSPGDSGVDQQAEFMMGMNFAPEESTAPTPDKKGRRTIDDLPDTAKVVSSEVPAPALDFNQDSDTH